MNPSSRRHCLRLLAGAPWLAGLAALAAPPVQAQSLPPRENRLHPWEPLNELPLLAACLQQCAQASQTRPLPALCPGWRIGLQRSGQTLDRLQADAQTLLEFLPETPPLRGRREALSALADELAHNSYLLATALEGLMPVLSATSPARGTEEIREIIFVLAFGQRARGFSLTTLQARLRGWGPKPPAWDALAMRKVLTQALGAIAQCRAPLAVLAALQPALLDEALPACNA